MFDPSLTPRVFGLPPGVDFPKTLVEGLVAQHENLPPEALARVTLVVNTRRMARRIQDLFDAGPARLLPRIELLSDLGNRPEAAHIPAAISPLQRRLELSQLVAGLLDRAPDLAPRAALYDLADSLAGLMDEMQGEGVPPAAIAKLDVSDQSGHWARALQFLQIVQTFFGPSDDALDAEARQRRVVENLSTKWALTPPPDPIIIAGSTGSRGTTLELMQAVALLPQGAIILPGFDFDMPHSAWGDLAQALTSEDHPQFRFVRVMGRLAIKRSDIRLWHHTPAPSIARNKVVSLALRPAPVTDCWLSEGPGLQHIQQAFETVTLVEAASRRDEAVAIALRLRQAAENGETAALVTSDRMLSRQVTAALDRWSILPDDSAGTPLHLTPPGRFLRHVGALFTRDTSAAMLLELLKHPLCHSAQDRNRHLLLARDLELYLRRHGPAFPERDQLLRWADKHSDVMASDWVIWIDDCLLGHCTPKDYLLTDWVKTHLDLAERIANGAAAELAGNTSDLWERRAGQKARETIAELSTHADLGGRLSAADYSTLFSAILAGGEVRDRDAPHPHILIWGTLEARVQGADLLILGGLNEGSWPEIPSPDPWLNRALRDQAGLLLPERRIGLAAHDFQQAIAAPKVWLTRSTRSEDAETVPSRWLNRLLNLLSGLPDQEGPETLSALRQRGTHWLAMAHILDAADPVPAALRPAPCPPLASRPNRLSVTEIKRLIRDPYAIYVRHVLKLRPLESLEKVPDPLLRGIVIHEILEAFCRGVKQDPSTLTARHLMDLTAQTLSQEVPWAAARALWLARMRRSADWFLAGEAQRLALAQPVDFEIKAHATLKDLGFTLTAKADRIDRDASGRVYIYDYKTGTPPSPAEQRYFDKQLLLEAALAENAAFDGLGPVEVAAAIYLGLGSKPGTVAAPLEAETPEQVWTAFQELILKYQDPTRGFTARRAMQSDKEISDYDQLARFGEWDLTVTATAQKMVP
jgi:ATP-dependent helicase/nuclease subunit B